MYVKPNMKQTMEACALLHWKAKIWSANSAQASENRYYDEQCETYGVQTEVSEPSC